MAIKEQIIYGSPMIVTLGEAMRKLHRDQLSCWTLARRNTSSLKHSLQKTVKVGKVELTVQYNPARAISSKARLDAVSISSRPCFLCRENRPGQQMKMYFEGAKGKKYDILVNPYPILPYHFIAASVEHCPQSIWHRYVDMLRLSKRAGDFTVLYNGPKSGASAPDHFHFQAVPSGILPLEILVRKGSGLKLLTGIRDAELYLMEGFVHGVFVIMSDSSKSASKLFYRLLDCTPIPDGDSEPRINVISCRHAGRYISIIVMRRCHRPEEYFSEDPAVHFAMSPGCVDMAGVLITVEKEDFDRLDSASVDRILEEVTITEEQEEVIVERLVRTQPLLRLDIVRSPSLNFEMLSYGAGRRSAAIKDGKIEYDGILYDEIVFDAKVPSTMFAEPSFAISFPSENSEIRSSVEFAGGLALVADGDCVRAVNVIGAEDHLLNLLSRKLPDVSDMDALKDAAIRLRASLMRDSCEDRACECNMQLRSEAHIRAVDETWGQMGF